MYKMMYAPNHPKLVAARRLFYENRRRYPKNVSCTLSFEQLLALYADLSLSFNQIRLKAGLADKGVQRLYDKYFAELFGKVSSSERHKLFMARKREVTAKHIAEGISTMPWYEAVSAGAASIRKPLRAYIPVQPNGAPKTLSPSFVYVGDTLCQIHPIMTARRDKRRCMRTSRLVIKTDTLDMPHLFPVLIPKVALGTFVIPGRDIAQALDRNDQESVLIVIQLKRGGQPYRCRLNCWPYLNNWQLLLR